MPDEETRELLRKAQLLHGRGRVDDAVFMARQALERDPDYVDALSYVGTTLVTRRLSYKEGLRMLELALELAPDDPGVNYSLGWCYEFVAYRLEKAATKPYRDTLELYRLAAERLQRTIDLNPEQKLREDAEDLLTSVKERLE
jgi:tetratricopeptide (TPR) repeat protein